MVLGAIWTRSEPEAFLHPKYRALIDKTAMEKYYLFDFEPKYKKAECLVRIDFIFNGTPDERYRPPLGILFEQYLWVHEPKSGVFDMVSETVVNSPVSAYIQFAEAMVRYANETDPRYKITVSDKKVLPGRDTMMAEGSWIDDSNYDPEKDRLWKRAVRGDAEAIFLSAEKMDPVMDLKGIYIQYMWAANCLPSSPLRTEAEKRAREKRAAMPPVYEGQIDGLLENFRKDAARAGVACRP